MAEEHNCDACGKPCDCGRSPAGCVECEECWAKWERESGLDDGEDG